MSRRAFSFAYNRRRLTPFYELRAPLDIIGGFQNFLTNTTNYIIKEATPAVISSARSALDTYVQSFNEYVARTITQVDSTRPKQIKRTRR